MSNIENSRRSLNFKRKKNTLSGYSDNGCRNMKNDARYIFEKKFIMSVTFFFYINDINISVY